MQATRIEGWLFIITISIFGLLQKQKDKRLCVSQCGALLAFSHLVYQVCLLCILHITSGADPGFCEGGFERGFVDSLKGTFEQK